MCPVCGGQLPDEEAEPAAEPDEDLSTEDLEECPECGKDLSSIPEDMRFVCPQCRVDLEEAIASMGGGDDEDDAATGGGADPPPASGPSGGGGEPAGVGGSSGGAGGTYEPPGGDAGSGGAPDPAPAIGSDDPGPTGDAPGGGPEPAASIGGPGGQPSEVVFEVLVTDVRAADGDKVGSDVRDAIVEGGLPEKKSKYVHREHVRVDRDGGNFYLTKIGPNPLELNGQALERGQRVQVEDGDELVFSELVTAEIRIE